MWFTVHHGSGAYSWSNLILLLSQAVFLEAEEKELLVKSLAVVAWSSITKRPSWALNQNANDTDARLARPHCRRAVCGLIKAVHPMHCAYCTGDRLIGYVAQTITNLLAFSHF